MTRKRAALAVGAELTLAGTRYTITDVLGAGANAICYQAVYDDDALAGKRHACLIKELFPSHERGLIRRDGDGRVDVDPQARSFFDLHKRSFLRGCSVGIDLNDARPDKSMPMLNTHEANGTLYAVIGISGGVPLESKKVSTLRDAVEIVLAILHALRPFHQAGLWHLDISPDNLLLMPRDKGEKKYQVLLIDYNSVFSSKEIEEERGVYFSVKKPFTAPEVRLGDLTQIGAAADLYSVAAVFARLIFPDFDGDVAGLRPSLPIFAGVPQTAMHKAIGIVRRGLRLSPRNRYQQIDDLLADFHELLDRIDRAGVTLPALWEASANQYKSMISADPLFSYVADCRIPSQLTASDIRENTLLTGDGGIGKTTTLLRIWHSGIEKYNPSAPVPLYLKLNDYSRERSIRMRCLDRLRFTEKTSTVLDALQALDQLFEQPGSVLLLLDGLNEAADAEREALLSEIGMLTKMAGVRIVVSSRSEVKELTALHREELAPLITGFVQRFLNENHLLYPENPTLCQLLTNPMMLTMYVAVTDHSNAHSDSFDETTLMQAYLSYAVSKANNPSLAGFSVNTLLPLIASAMARQKSHTLTGARVLECVEVLYDGLKGKRFYKQFAEYIGESTQLLSGAQNAEEWFATVIGKLAGRELNLLVKTESGQYTFAHQLFRDHFARAGRDVGKRLRGVEIRRRMPRVMLGIALAAALLLGIWGISQYRIGQAPATFPSTEEEIQNVNEAMAQLQHAAAYFDLVLHDAEWAIRQIKDLPPSADWSMFLSETEKRRNRAGLYYVVHPASIDLLVSKLSILGNTVDLDTYRELCQFSGAFMEENAPILSGVIDKALLLGDSARKQGIYDSYEAWLQNKAIGFTLMLRHTIDSLPIEIQHKVLDTSNMQSFLVECIRDNAWNSDDYETRLQATRGTDAALLSKFRVEGILK